MFVSQSIKQGPPVVTAKMGVRYSRSAATTMLGHARTLYRDMYRRAYQSHDYSPEEYFAELGKDGVEMLELMDLMWGMIQKHQPANVPGRQILPPNGLKLTRNADGKVTIEH